MIIFICCSILFYRFISINLDFKAFPHKDIKKRNLN